MRRVQTTLPISPRLLKHFAAATVAITFCVAIFADGSTTEAVKETVKHNELKKTEVDLLGVTKLVSKGLKVAPVRRMPIDNAPSIDQDFGGSTLPPDLVLRPAFAGPAMPLPSQFARPEDMLPERQAVLRARKTPLPHQPTDEEIARIQEESRLRSGSPGVD